MDRRDFIQGVVLAWVSALGSPSALTSTGDPKSSLLTVKSADGTLIAVEFAGAGPSLVLVHGGIGDHSRWQPLFPQFTPRFTLFAMDRRGHGASGDSPNYSLQKEAEDIAAVVNSCPGKVFLLAHSYGATCALEAAFLTPNIAKLVLYEPPIQVEQKFIDRVIVTELEKLIRNGEREEALVLFMRDIVKIPPAEIAAAKSLPSWATRVADIHSSVREIRATDGYTFDASRMRELTVPTLLLTGSDTAAHHKRAIAALAGSLPSRKVFVFEGQGHNAMDTVPKQFVEVVVNFLLATKQGSFTIPCSVVQT